MSLTSISIIMAVVVTNIYEKSRQNATMENRMPKIIRVIFIKYIARFLGMKKKTQELYELLVNLKNKEKSEARLKNSIHRKSSSELNGCSFGQKLPEPNPCLIQQIAFDLRKRRKERLKQRLHLNDGLDYWNANNSCANCESCCSFRKVDPELNECHSHSYANFWDLSDKRDSSLDRSLYVMPSQLQGTSQELTMNCSRSSGMSKKHGTSSKQKLKAQEPRRRRESSFFEAEAREVTSENDEATKRSDTVVREKRQSGHKKFKIKPDNLSLYIGYEYVLFSLILDRVFFWFYMSFTILSYFFTLYVVPFWIRNERKDYLYRVP
jgi:hypothetical protein